MKQSEKNDEHNKRIKHPNDLWLFEKSESTNKVTIVNAEVKFTSAKSDKDINRRRRYSWQETYLRKPGSFGYIDDKLPTTLNENDASSLKNSDPSRPHHQRSRSEGSQPWTKVSSSAESPTGESETEEYFTYKKQEHLKKSIENKNNLWIYNYRVNNTGDINKSNDAE